MADAEAVARELALAAGQDDALVLAHHGHEPAAVDVLRHLDAGDGVGGAGFVVGQELQAQGLDAGATVGGDVGVTLVHVFQALTDDVVEAQTQAVQEGDVGGPGRLPPRQRALGSHQVEVEAGHLGVLVGFPAAGADADERQAGRDHEALLGAGGHQVAVPAVHRKGDAAQAAHGVHQQQLVELALDHAGDGFQVVGDAGGGLVMGDEDGLDIGVLLEFGTDGLGVDSVAPLEVHAGHVGAVALGDLDKAVSKGTGGGGDDLIAGGQGVDHRGFQGAGAAGGEDVEVVGGHEDLLQTGGGGLDQLLELGTPVIDHGQGHLVHDVVGNGGRSWGAQVLGLDLGQGHRESSWWAREGAHYWSVRRLWSSALRVMRRRITA